MIFDSHMHSIFSTDSKMNILDAINVSHKKNIGIIITEHMDLDYPDKEQFVFDPKEYFNKYEKYRCDSLKLGIEIGLTTTSVLESEKIAKENDFDFVLGSIHAVRGLDIYTDFIKQGYDKKKFYTYYFEDMLKCAQIYNNFDSLSHIDYPCRYTKFDNNEIILSEFKDTLAEIFTTLINKEKVLELNSARLNNKASIDALYDIYKLYKDLGGKYVTLGSDSHSTSQIGRNFDIALDFIDNLNLNGVYFSKRKMNYFK